MNAVMVAVIVMLFLSLARVHVVLSLVIGALVGGLLGGLSLEETLKTFEDGLAGGAKIALSYAMLGAFAVAISHSGLPQTLAKWLIKRIDTSGTDNNKAKITKWGILVGILVISICSQNIIPIHIAFIPLIIPPLLLVFTRLQLDRRLIACVMTFGLVTTYMFLPIGFGEIFLEKILLENINKAGLATEGINVMYAMAIPAFGMLCGLLIAAFISYRKPRQYQITDNTDTGMQLTSTSTYRSGIAAVAIGLSFIVQLWADSLLLGALIGFLVFVVAGLIRWQDSEEVFNNGVKMMAMIGFIMITAQGFAEVMRATGAIEPLVQSTADMLADNKAMASLAMLAVGLLVTLGIGSSFSTLPILAVIYVPLCIHLGFSPLATIAIIGTAGALGDAGSPASDSTLGPTSGLNADGQHNHIRDTVIPTFLHYNIPLIIAGWVASMVL
ncbi:MAG: TRAP transporter large permease subunit [Gammaproteobacteria bacterium]|nr:TRAP transporter large permease subunit [Gammaproteobacteria bacterium]